MYFLVERCDEDTHEVYKPYLKGFLALAMHIVTLINHRAPGFEGLTKTGFPAYSEQASGITRKGATSVLEQDVMPWCVPTYNTHKGRAPSSKSLVALRGQQHLQPYSKTGCNSTHQALRTACPLQCCWCAQSCQTAQSLC